MKRCSDDLGRPNAPHERATGKYGSMSWFPPMAVMAAELSENSRCLLLKPERRPKSLPEVTEIWGGRC